MTAGRWSAPSSKTRPADLEFAPIVNGVDFLDRAIDELLDAHDQRELKYAVLHLQAATEVLVKVRLQREGFEHVFEDLDKADEAKWRRGDFKSVTLAAALTRLTETANITLTGKERRVLTRLARERNKLQHFGSTSNHEVVSNLAGTAMEVMARFIVDYLVPEAAESEQASLERAQEKIGYALREIASVAEARMVHITPELDEWSGIDLHCPNCTKPAWTFEPHGEEGFCRFCRTMWRGEDGWETAALYAENILYESQHLAAQGKSGWSISMCPNCDETALVDVTTRASPDVSLTLCFHCGFSANERLEPCGDCGRPVEQDVFLCSNCLAYKMARD